MPVHQSLLQAVDGATTTSLDEQDDATTSTAVVGDEEDDDTLVLRPWCTSAAEATLAHTLLMDPTLSWGRQLLLVQYFFRRCRASSSRQPSRLWGLLWRLWEDENPRFGRPSSDNDDDDDDRTDAAPEEADAFCQAVVQVAFAAATTTTTAGPPLRLSDWTQAPVENRRSNGKDEQDETSSAWYWQRTTLWLIQWATSSSTHTREAAVDQAEPPVSHIVVDFLERGLRAAWQSVVSQPWRNAAEWYHLPSWVGWKALTQLLLPAIVDLLRDDETIHTGEWSTLLWRRIWGFWKEMQQAVSAEDRPLLMLVATTLLCPIWHVLVAQSDLPVMDSEERRPVVEQASVWEFLYECLGQGLEEGRAHHSTAMDMQGKPALRAVTNLVRRRGLYLLRTLAGESLTAWHQYVACFETLEMEDDKHLVLQVWEVVGDLMAKAARLAAPPALPVTIPPPLTLDWLLVLLGHALTAADAPFLRKENMYRFCRGSTGILMPHIAPTEGQTKKKKTKGPLGAPLSMLPFDFVWKIVIPAFDTLERSVGLHVNWITAEGKTLQLDVEEAFDTFLPTCMEQALKRTESSKDTRWLVSFLVSDRMIQLRAKTITGVLKHAAAVLSDRNERNVRLEIEGNDLSVIATNLQQVFLSGRVVSVYRESILLSLATILAHTTLVGKADPKAVLSILGIFPYPSNIEHQDQEDEDLHWTESNSQFKNLEVWLRGIVHDEPSWSHQVPAALASAFVDGFLSGSKESSGWTPSSSLRVEERQMGRAIVFLCVLAVKEQSASTASATLWPAINKGLSLVPSALLSSTGGNVGRIERALILLEHGCKVQILSGTGNGDLVVDRKTNQMMPPPPGIEQLLSNAVSFVLHMIGRLLSAPSEREKTGSRSGGTRVLSAVFAGLVETLHTLSQGYQSSSAVSDSASEAFQMGVQELARGEFLAATSVQHLALVFASLCCDADVATAIDATCISILNLKLDESGDFKGDIQPIRSVFEYSRWGSLAILLPRLMESKGTDSDKICEDVLSMASAAVEACPGEALMPLFESVIAVGRLFISSNQPKGSLLSRKMILHLERLVQVLSRVMADCHKGDQALYMLDESSKLIFQPRLLLDEHIRLSEDVGTSTPIRDAFNQLVTSAGTQRPHIIRTILSRAIPGWMGDVDVAPGLCAIPYREALVDLIIYKEDRIETSSLSHVVLQSRDGSVDDKAVIPATTHELSLVRAFVLSFFSNLPGADEVNQDVREKLLHYLITNLLRKVKFGKTGLPMLGSPEYSRSLRGWQALCTLSRFVGESIAEEVCLEIMDALEEQLHGQTRFFIETFCIQCARRHPHVFGAALCKNLVRTDLNLQTVTSLMIITGNLVVGNYKTDFMPSTSIPTDAASPVSIPQLLAGSIPWLSSTQGFSRAIAQLLVHALVPLAVDLSKKEDDGSDWYLRSIYAFLEENVEMKRLRKKQVKFFYNMDADLYCTPDGCLSTPVDEVGEASPKHMVEIIKATLADVYKESHGIDAPTWKQVQSMIDQADDDTTVPATLSSDGGALVNFQRKIIPLDALNLALDEHREKRFRNLAGRRRQPLIVCASLVDKVPNLAGLARSCEIFAADRLVVPNKRVCKMDNFTSISVGASDWIDVEECPEKVCSKRDDGTSSPASLASV
jgi:hypothetical protein